MPDYVAIFEVLGAYARAFAQFENLADRNLELADSGGTFRSLDRLRQQFLHVLNDSPAERDCADAVNLLADAARAVRGWSVQLGASLDACLRGFVAAELGARGLGAAEAARELARAMHADGESVVANAVSLGPVTPGAHNAGDAVLYATLLNVDGAELVVSDQRARTQKISVVCTRDAARQGLAPGHEEFRVTPEFGPPVNLRVIPVTGGDFPDTRNVILDGAFESHDGGFTHWAVAAGGPVFSRDTGVRLFGTGSLKLAGDGATAGELRQDLAARDPAPVAGAWYGLGVWARVQNVTAGTVHVDLLLDGEPSDVALEINDATPADMWRHLGALVYLPRATFPGKVIVRVRCSADFDGVVNLDGLSLAPVVEVPHAGLRLCVFQGARAPHSVPIADRFDLSTTSDDAGAFASFARDRLGVALPVDDPASLDDTMAS
ncbi:MAG: hypothetical protein HS108_13360 [Planctomycetes bacterium]|jgi:hypothetical protein|nr:hypothetical protein [Planctomycetota bacterium]MCL4729467.1 hypothetical protein [Planctomycetota bacterium]